MDIKSPRCSATSNGRPHPLFIEGGPKLAVTLKSRENRVFADYPPHKNRTVRHSNPMASTAMIMCQSRPLEPQADCPLPRGGLSAVQNVSTHRNRSVSVPEFSVGGGPSAPKDRTVRSSFWTLKTEQPSFCARFSF